MNTVENAYNILHVNCYANASEVGKAFRREIGRANFPADLIKLDEEQRVRYEKLTAARDVLKEPRRKKQHDELLLDTRESLFLFSQISDALSFFGVQYEEVEPTPDLIPHIFTYIDAVQGVRVQDSGADFNDRTWVGKNRDFLEKLVREKSPEALFATMGLSTIVYSSIDQGGSYRCQGSRPPMNKTYNYYGVVISRSAMAFKLKDPLNSI